MAIRAETQVDLARVDDGFSPTATVTKTGDTATITITDKNQTTTASITDGDEGVSVTSVKPQYYLSTSSSSATGGSWSDTPQAFVSGMYYWTRDYIDYSDGTHDTSTAVYNAALTQANQEALEANTKADNVAQYFWFNSTDSGAGEGAGAHITEIPRDDFVDDPANGGFNTLTNAEGMKIRNGTDTLASYGQNIIVGNESDNSYTIITSDGFDVINKNASAISVAVGGGTLETFRTYFTKYGRIGNASSTDSKTIDTTTDGLGDAITGKTMSIGGSYERSIGGQWKTLGGWELVYKKGTSATKTFVYDPEGDAITALTGIYNTGSNTIALSSASGFRFTINRERVYVNKEVPLIELSGMINVNGSNIIEPSLDSTALSPVSSRCTIESGGVFALGKWRFVQLQLKIATSLSANNTWGVVSGFDLPATGSLCALAASVQKNYGNVSANIATSGNLVVQTAGAALAANDILMVTGWYITA